MGSAGCRLILLEGVPGSGKTTSCVWLTEQLAARGVEARWCDELDPDHPVIDRATKRTCREPGFADRCVERWRHFADSLQESRSGVWIIEACLFQNTVRFLLEHEHGAEACRRYAEGTGETLARLQPQLVYLTQPDTERFLSQSFSARKGDDIVTKVAAYTETTACARRHDWRGLPGTIAFYAHYREVCDGLLGALGIPTLEVDSSAPLASNRETLGAWLDRLAFSGQLRLG
jgi:hypothetical protein